MTQVLATAYRADGMAETYFVGGTDPDAATCVGRADIDVKWAAVNCVVLHYLHVEEEYRGAGIGSRLMQRVCEDADALGVTIELQAAPAGLSYLDKLVTFYESFGFEITELHDRTDPGGRHISAEMVRHPLTKEV